MKYLSHYTEKETTKAINNAGAFFAFSKEQYEEKEKPGIKYVSLKHGLICPKKNVSTLLKGLDNALEKGIKADFKENGFKKIVRREYFNHETQITMDNKSVVSFLSDYTKLFPEVFTVDSILAECKECFQEAIDNDLF